MNSANVGRNARCGAARCTATAAALLFLAAGCRLSPVSPVGTTGAPFVGITDAAAPSEVGASQPLVPVLRHLRAEVRNGSLLLTGNLFVDGHRRDLEYSPYRPGGWCLQVLVNTDQRRTGYWLGYEYIVRGVEWDPADRTAVVRRITLEPGYPGGWGPGSGQASLRADRGSFAVVVPLAAIGDDDGNLDFVIETYTTVACPECEPGYSQCYRADYFGTCSADGRSSTSGPVVLAGHRGPGAPRPHTGASAPAR